MVVRRTSGWRWDQPGILSFLHENSRRSTVSFKCEKSPQKMSLQSLSYCTVKEWAAERGRNGRVCAKLQRCFKRQFQFEKQRCFFVCILIYWSNAHPLLCASKTASRFWTQAEWYPSASTQIQTKEKIANAQYKFTTFITQSTGKPPFFYFSICYLTLKNLATFSFRIPPERPDDFFNSPRHSNFKLCDPSPRTRWCKRDSTESRKWRVHIVIDGHELPSV